MRIKFPLTFGISKTKEKQNIKGKEKKKIRKERRKRAKKEKGAPFKKMSQRCYGNM